MTIVDYLIIFAEKSLLTAGCRFASGKVDEALVLLRSEKLRFSGHRSSVVEASTPSNEPGGGLHTPKRHSRLEMKDLESPLEQTPISPSRHMVPPGSPADHLQACLVRAN